MRGALAMLAFRAGKTGSMSQPIRTVNAAGNASFPTMRDGGFLDLVFRALL
jgi:hypothetical protein